ncbi:MAG: T9SS type A sorting domain-containing protein [Taibaiella sp.]|nr:T9SS type A sorting domain-containing protein [Taibaiella sp.]
MKWLLSILFSLVSIFATAQFAPQAGISGSTAISATASEIVAWATKCSVQRGYIDIAIPSAGHTSTGDSSAATGPANGTVVCLGDSGIATLSFAASLYDGPGADFAVFENGFKDPANPSMAFLELAFVEVSSDGINFTRFPAISNTPANTQIPGSGVYMDASLIHNLAGKYVATFGTPFDLAELAGTPGLDIDNITHVRLVDVIGSVSSHTCLDNEGKIINDPYPTNFPTGGFDLDAVAAMHIHSASISNRDNEPLRIYPNPAKDILHIDQVSTSTGLLCMYTGIGNKVAEQKITGKQTSVDLTQLAPGAYYITLTSDSGTTQWAGNFIKL